MVRAIGEPWFHAGRVAAIHSRARASGSGLSVMSVTTETMSAPAARHSFARSTLRPPIATSGIAPMRRFHSPMRSQALRRESHGLENRRIDRPERDIVGIELERALKLGVVVGADAEPHAGLSDRADVGLVEIVLAEMDPSGALVDRDAPEIVDDEDRASLRASPERLARLARDPSLVLVLDPQLDEPRADAGQARDPSGAVDDRVEGIEARKPFSRHGRVGWGEGFGLMSARLCRRPASRARPCRAAASARRGRPRGQLRSPARRRAPSRSGRRLSRPRC